MTAILLVIADARNRQLLANTRHSPLKRPESGCLRMTALLPRCVCHKRQFVGRLNKPKKWAIPRAAPRLPLSALYSSVFEKTLKSPEGSGASSHSDRKASQTPHLGQPRSLGMHLAVYTNPAPRLLLVQHTVALQTRPTTPNSWAYLEAPNLKYVSDPGDERIFVPSPSDRCLTCPFPPHQSLSSCYITPSHMEVHLLR